MKALKKIAVVLMAVICLSAPMQAYAAETEPEQTAAAVSSTDEAVTPYAAGLISTYSVKCSAGTKEVKIGAQVHAFDTMSKLGFTDMTVERSSTGTGNWTPVAELPDDIAENVSAYSFSNYSVSVTGGYYYRVTVTFYAKEKGWFFPKSQTDSLSSKSVWVP